MGLWASIGPMVGLVSRMYHYVNLLQLETMFPKILFPSNFTLQLVRGEFVGDLKGRSKATAFTLGRWLWLIMVSHKMQEMPRRFRLVLCPMYPAYASDCGPCQPKAAPQPPPDISLGTHGAGSHVQTTAFHRPPQAPPSCLHFNGWKGSASQISW